MNKKNIDVLSREMGKMIAVSEINGFVNYTIADSIDVICEEFSSLLNFDEVVNAILEWAEEHSVYEFKRDEAIQIAKDKLKVKNNETN